MAQPQKTEAHEMLGENRERILPGFVHWMKLMKCWAKIGRKSVTFGFSERSSHKAHEMLGENGAKLLSDNRERRTVSRELLHCGIQHPTVSLPRVDGIHDLRVSMFVVGGMDSKQRPEFVTNENHEKLMKTSCLEVVPLRRC